MTAIPMETADPYGLMHPERRKDPYTSYARMHRDGPVHYCEPWGAWLVVRYSDVTAGFRDLRLLSARTGQFGAGLSDEVRKMMEPLARNLASWTLFLDAPSHTRLRGLITKAFTPRMVETLRPRIRALIEELLDAARGKERMEIISELANPLPVIVIGEMLGLPRDDRHRLKRWSDQLAGLIGTGRPTPEQVKAGLGAILEFEAYFRTLIARRRTEPANDLLSALVHAEEQGSLLSEQELLSTCTMLLFGGHETTTNLIGNGLLALLRHPEQWELLRASPELLPDAVEEFLRYDPPVQFTNREASVDMEIGGKAIRKGERVMLMMAAANRDPAQFKDPDTLNVRREELRHMTLGLGPHYCLGAALGRMEAQETFAALMRRFPNLKLEPGASLDWLDSAGFRGLLSLPVVLGAEAR
ncbi:MAG TPA: cytochrome P450 [Archangium sp.]|uniref:cytochrome P450 n=1 Tax=Archangium sp. TaxID=1872627 RepID=UPI002E31D948|nr:cytochrome P450 [Archangium sp.]HEX5747585.1 cytochrome P450 [Archangium sp.]